MKTSSQKKQFPGYTVVRPATAGVAASPGSALFLKQRWLLDLKKRKKNKYNAVKAKAPDFYPELTGMTFDSKLERDRACHLVRQMRQGLIRNLRFQPIVFLTDSNLKYHPDFSYEEQVSGFKGFHKFYEEVKGIERYPWITIKQLWPEYGAGILRVVKRRGGKFRVTEEIMRGACIKFVQK